jgi:hypothetical protein
LNEADGLNSDVGALQMDAYRLKKVAGSFVIDANRNKIYRPPFPMDADRLMMEWHPL